MNLKPTTTAPDEPSRWLLSGDLPCLECEYNLRGLVGPLVRCPECGHANNLRDPAPWKMKQLPIGVRQRAHWPASAALVSFWFFPVILLMLRIDSGWGLLISDALLLVGLSIIWLRLCVRWVRSCHAPAWAVVRLAAVHLAAWGWIAGVAGCTGGLALADAEGIFWVLGLSALLPFSALTFVWLHRSLKRGEDKRTYRVDWQHWRLPTGTEGEESAAES